MMGKIMPLRQPGLGKQDLRPGTWQSWLPEPASSQNQERPREEGWMGRHLSPTKHRQSEQEILPQLVA